MRAVIPRRVAVVALVVSSFLTRLPALLDTTGPNSDVAVVGLQARHILHGEWSPFLWGSGYQTSADSTSAALVFLLLGKTPLALMLSALVLYVILTLFVFFTLERHMCSPWRALVATLPLVMTTACVHSYALYPPRQLALTVAFAAFFAVDRRRPFTAGLLAMFAWLADPYAMVLVPGVLVRGAFAPRAPPSALVAGAPHASAKGGSNEPPVGPPAKINPVVRLVLGVLVGAVPLAALLLRREAKHGVLSVSLAVLGHNAELLWRECLPWAIGTKVYRPLHVMDYAAWPLPVGYVILAYAGALSLVLVLALSVKAMLDGGRTRSLAYISWATIALVFVGFLTSRMVMDHFSMRYLAAAILVLPFVIAPWVDRASAGHALLLAPYLLSAVVGGWLTEIPVHPDKALHDNDAALLSTLEDHHVEAAVADYWAAYRLDFLWREALPVVPYHPEQDRYPPYRQQLEGANRIAYVYDVARSFEDPQEAAATLERERRPIGRIVVGQFQVVLLERQSVGSDP